MTDSVNQPENLYDLIQLNTRKAIYQQRTDGSFPPTRSGIYNTDETPVRNTSRWLLCLLHSYQYTGNREFAKAAQDAADFLCAEKARPSGNTFKIRENGFDKCDGLVGQAEPIKSLTLAGTILNSSKYTETAIEVFDILPFSEKIGLWEAVEVNGKLLSFDRTLNHQLIFAGYVSELCIKYSPAEEQIRKFLQKLNQIIQIRDCGLVRHYVRPPISSVLSVVRSSHRHYKMIWNEIISRYYRYSSERRDKELGYHPTIMFALSLLKKRFRKNKIWNHQNFASIQLYTKSEEYRNQISEKISEYGSLLPAIHHACALNTFERCGEDVLKHWVQKDIDRAYDPETGQLTRNSVDPAFQASSISAAIELPNIDIYTPHPTNDRE